MRQTILNLAVRGKLVPQDPKDEPASELLKRIAREGALRFGNSGPNTKVKEATHPRATAGEQDFEVPLTWTWARLN